MPRLTQNWILRVLAVVLGLGFLAFTRPQVGQSIELTTWLNARRGASFARVDTNKITSLPPGTRGTIARSEDIVHFKGTGNYGICLTLTSRTSLESRRCVWVYYNVKDPSLKLFAAQNAPAPSVVAAQSAVALRQINGIAELANQAVALLSPRSSPPPAVTARAAVDSQAVARSAVASINNINQNAGQLLSTANCPNGNCAPTLNSFGACTAQNNYLENELAQLKTSPLMSTVLNLNQAGPLKTSCIQKSLEVFGNLPRSFRQCGAGQSGAGTIVPKACVSENYTQAVAKSFNSVATCLSDYVGGRNNTKDQVTTSMFSLMSLESGLHINAVSGTGAGGPGQLTYDAITGVNSNLGAVRDHLAKSQNPLCSQTLLRVLQSPMNANRLQACDRIALSDNNPLKNMLYTFAFQASQRRYIESRFFDTKTFEGLLSTSLPASERSRLMMSLSMWSHNTGAAGLSTPLRALFVRYMRQGKAIRTAQDVSQLLVDLKTAMVNYSHPANARRTSETSRFFQAIQDRVALITPEVKSCLAN